MRRALALGDDAPACPAGEVLDPACGPGSDLKRFAGWGLLGAFAGALLGHHIFPKHMVLAVAAGVAGGSAVAAKSSIDKCFLGRNCVKA